ncbi:hypothetical protein GCM10010174_26540 [Kutzneria viridogrisea]|uniref:LemA protein n=1 Tax=Kutzneria viridogrisea TaxID=47990 RepID=A0ABR6BRN1_9PSEU|nr:LemA protein [Kutzneria viridogrisea]
MLVLVLVILLLALVSAAVATHYRFAAQRGAAELSWQQLDAELQHRHQLIGELIAAARASGADEDALTGIVQARSQAMASSGAGVLPQAEAERSLNRVLAAFGPRSADLEASDRRVEHLVLTYNEQVQSYNERVQTFPSSLVAKVGKFEPAAEYPVRA